jgi:hypothetical protein
MNDLSSVFVRSQLKTQACRICSPSFVKLILFLLNISPVRGCMSAASLFFTYFRFHSIIFPSHFSFFLYDSYAPDGGGSSWPAGLNNTAAYLARPDVQKAIHTDIPNPRVWEECDGVWLDVSDDVG